MMSVKMYFFIANVFISANILAQNYSLDSYRNNPNYEVKILEDSTVEIYNKANNFRWKKILHNIPNMKETLKQT
jgi:hypothetical protein